MNQQHDIDAQKARVQRPATHPQAAAETSLQVAALALQRDQRASRSPSPADIVALQQTVGNAAVNHFLHQHESRRQVLARTACRALAHPGSAPERPISRSTAAGMVEPVAALAPTSLPDSYIPRTESLVTPRQERYPSHDGWDAHNQPQSRLQKASAVNINSLIQRYPIIGEEGTEGKEARTWKAVADFLDRHDQHVFHGYSVDLNKEGGEQTIFSQIKGTYLGAAGARKLSSELLQRLKQGLTDERYPRGQKVIMRKLAEIMELVRRSRGDLEHDRALAISTQLYHDSGLCFGFTEIYKRHAQWEMALWHAVAQWQPSGGSSKQELGALNDHLERTINWAPGVPRTNALEATLLLKEAWEYMQEAQENEYRDLPRLFAGNALTGTGPEVEPVSLGQTTRLIKSEENITTLIRQVQKIVLGQNPMPPKLVLEISTGFHSMMASYQHGQLAFLEPELWGVVPCTWDELATMLYKTLQHLAPGDFKTGIAMDIDVHAQISPSEVQSNKSILESLQTESLASFKGIEKESDPAKFLEEYNTELYELMFPEENKEALPV